MPTIVNDLIEVTSIDANTTYAYDGGSGDILGVVDGAEKSSAWYNPDEEFNEGETLTIDGVVYTIDTIEEPTSNGSFLLGDGSSATFGAGSENDLEVMFLTVSSGTDVRHFILPNDSYGDMNIQAITLGGVGHVSGNDAFIDMDDNDTIDLVCFTGGTMIEMASGGAVPIETLKSGDLVLTVDNGPQEIRWIGAQSISAQQLKDSPKLRPICISAGALGPKVPNQDLCISPQHRILVRSKIAQRIFERPEVLVAAKQLTHIEGIGISTCNKDLTYYHILFDQHEVVISNGAQTESLFTGPEALKTLSDDARKEIFSIFPELASVTHERAAARTLASGKKARHLAARHATNNKSLFGLDMAL